MLAALALASLVAAPVQQQWTFKTGESPQIKVSNVSGTIEVKAGGSEVAVESRSDKPDVWVAEATQDGDQISVRACCGSCHEHGNRCSSKGYLDLILKVPAGARVDASNVSGDTRLEGVQGRIQVNNVSGNVAVRGAAAPLEVSSVSGDVVLQPRTVAACSVSTVSGDVKLELPQGASADVHLSSVSGHIEGGGKGSRSHRVFGEGGEKIAVSTVSGDVKVAQ